jgi:hypothetical protein
MVSKTTADSLFADDPQVRQDIAWLNVNEIDELKTCADPCVDRWKAAAPDARKKMFDMFAIAGIFICACRHGHVLLLCDMIRSGELSVLTFCSQSLLLMDNLQNEIWLVAYRSVT